MREAERRAIPAEEEDEAKDMMGGRQRVRSKLFAVAPRVRSYTWLEVSYPVVSFCVPTSKC